MPGYTGDTEPRCDISRIGARRGTGTLLVRWKLDSQVVMVEDQIRKRGYGRVVLKDLERGRQRENQPFVGNM